MIRITNSLSRLTRKFFLPILFGLAILLGLSTEARAVTFTVVSSADSGVGTLRQAILDSNASVGVFDTIDFLAVTSIALTTPLPSITDPVMIDGGATPTVELNGLGTQGAGSASIGLYIRAGGTTVRGMIINRFGEAGIRMDTDGIGVDNLNIIIGNRIGTDTAGTAALGNINRGILIVATIGHSIGNGTTAGSNLISGNSGRGIDINAGGSALIAGNLIGTNAAGTGDLGNLGHGVQIVNSSNSTVGGTTAGARNIISGNNGSGIFIVGDIGTPASNNVISGNYIGVDSTGNAELQNSGSGVTIQDSINTVGGTTTGARNVISGNGVNGVSISTTLATGNTVAGNYIGIGANGTTSIPNNNNGVQFSSGAFGNTIGGTGVTPGVCNGACNIIANNGVATAQSARAGIYADQTAGTRNSFRQNSIFMNGVNPTDIGIDIGPSAATANDANDPDLGANDLQNAPVLNSANTAGVVGGTLNSTPNTIFGIDYYRNDATDTAVLAEARTYIGSASATTDASGNTTLSFSAGPTTLTAGQFVTATATTIGGSAQAVGDTSELSNAQAVIAATPGGAVGIEADVAPRPNGDGSIFSNDVVQVRRFLNESDTYNTSTNEYQRTDSAPFSSKGDGAVAANDVVQTRRYQNETDPLQTAGGPTSGTFAEPGGTVVPEGKLSKTAPGIKVVPASVLRVEQGKSDSGKRVTVNLRIDTVGGESEYGFILDYDSSKLSNPVIGAGDAGAAARVCNASVAGRINCSVGAFPNNLPGSSSSGIGELLAGNDKTLITVTFDVVANAAPGVTLLTLSNVNVSNDAAELMRIVSTNGAIAIGGTSSGPAPVSGIDTPSNGHVLSRVLVELTRDNGQKPVAITNSLGNYRFENVETGENYVVTPRHSEYRFTPRNIALNTAKT